SGRLVIVILASEASLTTPETMACSIIGSSSSIQVPGSQVKADRTCSGTLWVRAYSTALMAGLGQPQAVSSSISSKLTRASLRAVGTTRGSVVNTPDTSV